MERHEAEAIYEAGRERCVDFMLELQARYERLEGRVEKLEEQLRQSSRNSSRPPSGDPPGAQPQRPQTPSGRRAGGQPGHPGRHRPLLSIEAVERVVEHFPERCACGHRFSEAERVACGEPVRHQVHELPEIAVELTEHRLERVRCPACGRRTTAELPTGVPLGALGPRLCAAVAALSVRNRVSRRDAVALTGELFGCRLSSGTVDAILRRTGEALARPYDELLRQVRCAPAVNVDETGWRLRGSKRTLWGAITPRAAVFRLAPDRHEREARALLGEDFTGVASSDRWWAYNYLDPEHRQVCWSHLVRDLTAHAEGLAAQKDFGEAGLQIAARLFAAWAAFKADGDRAALKRRLAPLRRELRALLERHARKSARHRRTRTFAKNLLKVWPALWTFTEVGGVEPTNNAAERGLRGAVIYRKLSLGSQSEEGERTIERLLSVSQTCRLQGRSLFAYLTDVLIARARGQPAPLLV